MRYKTYCFGDLVEKWIDNRGKTPPLSENGIPLLEVKHLPESNLYPKIVGTKFVDKETYDSWFRAYLEPNDILFSTVGTTARVVMTPPTETVAIAQNILGIRFKKDLVDPWFMFYYMRGKQFQHDIEARLVTTVQASIKRADMVGIPIAVPQLDAQKELVHRVISLDHKIQLNQDINQTLEQMAQALFKSWFVDFEPVKAKIAVLEAGGSQEDATRAAMTAISGKDAHALAVFEREHPEQYAELKTTAELFPSAMQDSELGEIPVGWMVNSTSEHYSISIGKTPPRKEAQWFSINSEDLKWVSIKDMGIASTYISETSERLTHEAVKKFNIKVMPANTVFLSFKLTVGRVCITTEEMCSNEAIAHFTPKENKYESHWLYHALKSFNFNKLGSTSSIATAVNSKTIKEMKLIFPNKIIAKKFTKKVSSIMKLQQLNSEEINGLTELRDTLLPKLLSGEITLPEAEQIISEEA
ncbi:restriction endonuclease subunit S [Klebsiella pneumoniae]|uniref:restriction endonuclease subunit S n=1 Tax=Klebsiella pneumoniae TaxID=573 RepID=UPI002858422B|nr:restriction endonuclease subunit S [Salmonella enterica subsp. enterica serovar Mbandaka]EJE3245604.1 restriction endonuclease subunit S [Salmonella enterica]EJE3277282.1 restriction endonuclease subunit S [Salmonella enterica]ELC5607160.1 restriction endonuclease subunit S [Salmonella enterica]ELD2860056.1 restriction endonuclease subunit S [Salmonella enterica]